MTDRGILIGFIRHCQNHQEVADTLLSQNLVDKKKLKDIHIYRTYCHKAKRLNRLTAVFDTSIRHGISVSRVYEIRKKFERKR